MEKKNDSIDDILLFIQKNKKELLGKYHIVKIGVFGSFARHENNPESDIDLIVEFDESIQNIYETKRALKLLFKERFNRDVDIAREKYLKPRIKDDILKDAVYAWKKQTEYSWY